MKKLLLTVCTIGLFLSLPVKADKVSKVKEMLKMANYDKTINTLLKQQILIPFECGFIIPADKKGTIKKELLNTINIKNLENSIVQFQADFFTESELDEILKFHKTSVGQKSLQFAQEFTLQMPKMLEGWLQEAMPKLENFVEKMSKEYGQRSGSEIQSCIQSYQK